MAIPSIDNENIAPQWTNLFVLLAVLFGGAVRFMPTALAGRVINDGGMFYVMIQELQASGFHLPAYTSYNHLGIPFAYPPLALYSGALLSAVGVPAMQVLRWLPVVVSASSIMAFYWLAAQILQSKPMAAVSACMYALMPRSFSWYVMGGGLSRSFGILFLLLTCGAAWLLFTKPHWKYVLLTIVFGAAAVLSHPEAALHTAAVCALIWLFVGRSMRAARDALLAGLGIVAVTAPWWASVLVNHGIGPFASAIHTGGGSPSLLSWLMFNFGQEPFAAVLTALGLLGLSIQCVRRQWLIPAWTLLPFLIDPRSAPAIAVLPLAMLASVGLTQMVIPQLVSLQLRAVEMTGDWTESLACSTAARIVTGAVLLYGFFGAAAYDFSLAGVVLPDDSRSAMQWVQQNTPPAARFVVLTGSSDPFADAVAEWFPALTARESINTLQGREWLLGPSFMPFLDDVARLQHCLNQTPDCVAAWAQAHGATYDYIYIQEDPDPNRSGSVLLVYTLERDSNYRKVYDKAGTIIFARP